MYRKAHLFLACVAASAGMEEVPKDWKFRATLVENDDFLRESICWDFEVVLSINGNVVRLQRIEKNEMEDALDEAIVTLKAEVKIKADKVIAEQKKDQERLARQQKLIADMELL